MMNEAKLLDKIRTLTERIERLEAESIRRRASIPTIAQGLLTETVDVSAGSWSSYPSKVGKVRLFEHDGLASSDTRTWNATGVEIDVVFSPPAQYERGVWVYAIRDDNGLWVGTSAGCDPTATGSPPV